jgi:uroporphyrinogen decarboxylase
LVHAAPQNDLFLRALRREPVERLPVWLMRQAGRYLPEYNATRKKAGSFLQLCQNPELACEVTLQPIDRYGLDAAILFSDILTIPDALGLGLHFVEGEGPRFHRRIEQASDIEGLPGVDAMESLRYVPDAVSLIRKTLNGRVPLIGFSGSPWTLGCYMLSGGSSGDDFLTARKWIYSRPDLVDQLLSKLVLHVSAYCQMQIDAGAQTIMLFDSWGGLLPASQVARFSLQPLALIVGQLRARNPDIPIIVFVKGGGHWAQQVVEQTGCQAIGLDWTVQLGDIRAQVGDRVALQGNLDPAVLLGTPPEIRRHAQAVVQSFGKREPGVGHIFNLGHGISQFTPVDHVHHLVEAVAQASADLA